MDDTRAELELRLAAVIAENESLRAKLIHARALWEHEQDMRAVREISEVADELLRLRTERDEARAEAERLRVATFEVKR